MVCPSSQHEPGRGRRHPRPGLAGLGGWPGSDRRFQSDLGGHWARRRCTRLGVGPQWWIRSTSRWPGCRSFQGMRLMGMPLPLAWLALQASIHEADEALAVQLGDHFHLIQKPSFLVPVGLDVTPFHPAQILASLINVHFVFCGHFSLQ